MKDDEARDFLRKNKLNSPLVDADTELQLRRHRLDIEERDAKRLGKKVAPIGARRKEIDDLQTMVIKRRSEAAKAHS